MGIFQNLNIIYTFIRPVLDVAILAFLLYKAWDLLARTQAVQLIKGAGLLLLVYGAAALLNLSTLEWLLTTIAPGLIISIAIVFQPELRKIFIRLGQTELFSPGVKTGLGSLDAVVTAAEMLSREKRGMLIVFARRTNIRNVIDTGTRLNADISSTFIMTLFKFDTPLHDGAMVIQNNRIAAAGCLLPLSEQQDIKKSFGTRHRAALGMTEQSDAVVMIVSEETGAISLAFDGMIFYDLSPSEISLKARELIDKGVRRQENEKYESLELEEDN